MRSGDALRPPEEGGLNAGDPHTSSEPPYYKNWYRPLMWKNLNAVGKLALAERVLGLTRSDPDAGRRVRTQVTRTK